MSLVAFLKSLPLWMAMALGQVSYGFSQQTDARGTAFVVVSSDVAGSIRVEVRGDDGTVVKKTVSVKAGQEKKVTWTQKKAGSVHYTAHVESGDNYADFEFDCARPYSADQVRLTPKSTREDLVDRHQITYETSFPITRYEFAVYDPAGEMSDSKTEASTNIAPGERFTIPWDSYDDVFLVELKAFGPNGESASDRRVPWSLEIPHTEVNFDSGKAIIKPSEEPKVDEVWAILAHELDKLDRANAAVNADLSAQLYIVGYTDTVGNNRDNQQLSQARARAIAEYFQTKGVWCEIYYAGMGERGLAVETGDNVDEVRNRRALYLLSPQTPGGG
ncbi:MAG: OmpA family protein, partial [Nannocystaceae bacterium]